MHILHIQDHHGYDINIYMYMCVYIYTCVYIYIYIYMCVHMHVLHIQNYHEYVAHDDLNQCAN